MQDINAGSLQTTSAQEADVNIDDTAEKFRARIDSAETLEDATAVGNDINTAKPALGTALFTELKNKATRRYHLVKHRAMLDEAINGLPQPDAPDAATCFEMVEKKLSAAKRHLGDELHDKYRITLDDMKPEYVG